MSVDTKVIPPDPELERKAKKVSEKVSENMHILANEPSLAFYRIHEHIGKSLPSIIDKRKDIESLHEDLQGACYDVEYALGALKSIINAESYLDVLTEQLKNAIFLKQQIKYDNSKRKEKRESTMYQRFSNISLDLGDLPDALRSTASRVESVFSQAANDIQTHRHSFHGSKSSN